MEVIRLKHKEKSFSITETLPFAIAILDQVYDGDFQAASSDLKDTKLSEELGTIEALSLVFENENIVSAENYAPIEYDEFVQYLAEHELAVENFKRGTFGGFQDKILSIADRGDYESAQKFLDLLLNSNLDKAVLCELKGTIYLESGEEEEGIKWLQKALEIDPSLVNAYSFLGQTFYNRKEFDKAAECWERELIASPDHLVTYFMLTDAYMNAGRSADAMNILKNLSQRDPDNLIAKIEMVELYERAGKVETARAIEEEILEALPVYINDVEVWARVQFKHKNFSLVEEQARKFLERDPDRPELKMLLVITSAKSGDFQEARQLLKDFQNEQIWYFYGKKELFDAYLTEEERKTCGIL